MLLRSTASHVKLVSLAIGDTSDMSLSLMRSAISSSLIQQGGIYPICRYDEAPNGLTRLTQQAGIHPILLRRQDTVLSNRLIPQEA